MTLSQRLFGRLKTPARELIGQANRLIVRWRNSLWSNFATRDWTQADFRFWDRARRCKAVGLELSGLFIKPLGSKIAAWTLGDLPTWKVENPATEDALNAWWADHHSDILRTFEEAVDLGDCYMVVNADLSVTVVPPHIVEPMVADDDYSKLIGWRITEVYPHPTNAADTMTVVDEYTATQRVHLVRHRGATISRKTHKNVIGRIPVIHIPNVQGADEMFGRPEGERLTVLLQRYGEVLDAAIKGNIRQGRPTPVMEKMGTVQQIKEFWETFGKTERQTLPDGTVEETPAIEFDADQLVTMPGDATFKWASPGSFMGDTEKLLGLLFYLMLQSTELPEFIWGNAIASSKASAEAQMPPFVRFIDKKRGLARKWLTELAQIVIAYQSVIEPGVRETDVPSLEWASLTDDDGNLTLKAIELLLKYGAIDRETAVRLSPLPIENPADVVAAADAEAEAQRQAQEDQMQAAIDRLANAPDDTSGDDTADDEDDTPQRVGQRAA